MKKEKAPKKIKPIEPDLKQPDEVTTKDLHPKDPPGTK